MAVTADVVEVRLRADTAQYVNNLKQADAAFSKTVAGITANNARIDQSSGALSSSVTNLGFQIQDVLVQAQAGTNGLVVGFQQGTQAAAVFNGLVAQGISPVKALGMAFSQVLNPISLATIATIALGTAAIQYFSTIIAEAGPASESLKEQNDRIREVADRWGEAVPALKAYVDQLEAAADAGNLEQAYGDAVARQFENLRAILPDLRVEFAAARTDLAAIGAESSEIDTLQSAFDALASKISDGTATGADLEALMTLLANTTGSQTVPSLVNLAGVLQAVTVGLNSAANAARTLADERDRLTAFGPDATGFFATGDFVAEQTRLNGLTAEQLALENEISRVKADAERSGATALTDAEALALATDNLAASERRRLEAKAAGGGAKAVTDLERERQAVVELIEQLEFEYGLIGATNTERAVANALRDAGAVATDAQRARIEELTVATLAEQQALDDLNRISQEWANTIQSATRGFIDDLIEGKSAAEAFSNVLADIGSKFIDLGLNSLFGGAGFNLAGLLGGTATRATGGPVYAGNPTLVGEKGPEVFVPSGPGKIVPASQAGGGGSVTFAPVIDARGADMAAVARIEQNMQKLAADIIPTIRHEIATGPKKGRR